MTRWIWLGMMTLLMAHQLWDSKQGVETDTQLVNMIQQHGALLAELNMADDELMEQVIGVNDLSIATAKNVVSIQTEMIEAGKLRLGQMEQVEKEIKLKGHRL